MLPRCESPAGPTEPATPWLVGMNWVQSMRGSGLEIAGDALRGTEPRNVSSIGDPEVIVKILSQRKGRGDLAAARRIDRFRRIRPD